METKIYKRPTPNYPNTQKPFQPKHMNTSTPINLNTHQPLNCMEEELYHTLIAIKDRFTRDEMGRTLSTQVDLLLIKINAGLPLSSKMSAESSKHLQQLLQQEFESKDWMFSDQIIQTTEEAGYYTQAEKMRKTLKEEGHVVD